MDITSSVGLAKRQCILHALASEVPTRAAYFATKETLEIEAESPQVTIAKRCSGLQRLCRMDGCLGLMHTVLLWLIIGEKIASSLVSAGLSLLQILKPVPKVRTTCSIGCQAQQRASAAPCAAPFAVLLQVQKSPRQGVISGSRRNVSKLHSLALSVSLNPPVSASSNPHCCSHLSYAYTVAQVLAHKVLCIHRWSSQR